MSSPVICLRTVEKIRRIVKILGLVSLSHNGFPVVEDYTPENSDPTTATFGRLKGFILKSQLERILLGQDDNLCEDELDSVIDLRMHMDRSPYIVQEDVSLPKIFKLFRGIGLRHLVVVNDRNRVVGIITRINLAKYRAENKKGQLKLAELQIDDR
ncbi:H(+)/Cl(-) exchange transporter 7 [Lamellibrachia satsuma]|nr:H(+)/Cl(-) exchange transporter 7 [Lamellibrachia satsuma]